MSKITNILITGGAGFIGSHLAEILLKTGYRVFIVDNFDDYYNPDIKLNNLNRFIDNNDCFFLKHDVRHIQNNETLKHEQIDCIVHLASKPGVRKSVIDPGTFKTINIESTNAVIHFAQEQQIKKIIFASSSSVYGNQTEQPWHENLNNLHPLSPYARYKLECEASGKAFGSKNDQQFLSLRFFSVYGPRMRPDLAMYRFAEKIIAGQTIEVYGDGTSYRDYTYIDDIISGITASINYNKHGFDIFNLAYGEKISLINMISALEQALDKKAKCKFSPEIKEESSGTWSDISKAKNTLNYHPKTDFSVGIKAFCQWYQQNH
jgi:UDP-glucuronate 4-epimerase